MYSFDVDKCNLVLFLSSEFLLGSIIPREVPQADRVLSAVCAQHLLDHDPRPHHLEGRHALPPVGRRLLELLAEHKFGGGRPHEGLLGSILI